DADDEAEFTRGSSRDAGRAGLEHGRMPRLDVEAAAGGEEDVRRRPGGQVFLLDDGPVDPRLDQAGESGPLQHRPRVGARGDDRAADARLAGQLEVAARALEGSDAVLFDQTQQDLVLP